MSYAASAEMSRRAKKAESLEKQAATQHQAAAASMAKGNVNAAQAQEKRAMQLHQQAAQHIEAGHKSITSVHRKDQISPAAAMQMTQQAISMATAGGMMQQPTMMMQPNALATPQLMAAQQGPSAIAMNGAAMFPPHGMPAQMMQPAVGGNMGVALAGANINYKMGQSMKRAEGLEKQAQAQVRAQCTSSPNVQRCASGGGRPTLESWLGYAIVFFFSRWRHGVRPYAA
jgi:hypothetical protein